MILYYTSWYNMYKDLVRSDVIVGIYLYIIDEWL